MKQDDPIQRALTTIRLQGQLIDKRDDAVLVRRGASVFQASTDDVVEIRQTGDTVEVLLKAGCTLIRSTAVRPVGGGRIVGVGSRRPGGGRADECSDCTECGDCTECSECECSDCSVCTGGDCWTPHDCAGGGGGPADCECSDPGSEFSRPSSRWVRRGAGRSRR